MKREDISILIIDDEEIILKTITEMLSDYFGDIDTALNTETAREKIQKKEYSIIICDDRLDGQTGLDFFISIKEIYPDIIKILITGYQDFDRIRQAINQAEIFRFISKPFDFSEFLNSIDQAAKMWLLKKNEKKYLAELNNKNLKLQELYELLKKDFDHSIQILIQIIETYNARLGTHSKAVQELSALIASAHGLNKDEIDIIRYAGALHDIGLIGCSRILLEKNIIELSPEERYIVESHPIVGQKIMGDQYNFQKIGLLIRHHHENFDSSGYPDRLRGHNIPFGSRIIAIANFIDNKLHPWSENRPPISVEELIKILRSASNNLFDPSIVDIGIDILKNHIIPKKFIIHIPIESLKEGMILANNIYLQSGALLLPKNTKIDKNKIKDIKRFLKWNPLLQRIFIYYNPLE